MERRFMNGYVIAPPDAQLAPYPDFCRDCGQRMTLYTPVDLRPAPSNNGIIARYACDRSHGWETFWGDLPYGPPVVRPAPKPGSPRCALYRHYDDEGILLYVGISEKPLGRGKAHAKESVWVAFAARIEAEWLPDRATAETAERNAIRAEKPIFNKVHALVDANARIADYLASRGA